MLSSQITSLHSPHLERVKALLGSRGKKFRQAEKCFVADGMQSIREAIVPTIVQAPKLEILYATDLGLEKLNKEFAAEVLSKIEIYPVSDSVMNAMADTQSPQGILAICSYTEFTLYKLGQLIKDKTVVRLAYFWEIQDPGNSGTVIRTADACGFDAVIFSPKSVDIYSPKTVRATVGSLWHIPVVEAVTLEELLIFATENQFKVQAFAGDGAISFLEVAPAEKSLLIFGNEARGLPEFPIEIARVSIPMAGRAESLNVASAAAISMFHVGIIQATGNSGPSK
jgi:TrmH family RNA methyltransferase